MSARVQELAGARFVLWCDNGVEGWSSEGFPDAQALEAKLLGGELLSSRYVVTRGPLKLVLFIEDSRGFVEIPLPAPGRPQELEDGAGPPDVHPRDWPTFTGEVLEDLEELRAQLVAGPGAPVEYESDAGAWYAHVNACSFVLELIAQRIREHARRGGGARHNTPSANLRRELAQLAADLSGIAVRHDVGRDAARQLGTVRRALEDVVSSLHEDARAAGEDPSPARLHKDAAGGAS